KASAQLSPGARVEASPPHPWVSRGGVKLAHALEHFGFDPAGRPCLDIGASTGGFTQVLLARGAALVIAVDVGQGQLHPSLASDAHVVSLEKTDARALPVRMREMSSSRTRCRAIRFAPRSPANLGALSRSSRVRPIGKRRSALITAHAAAARSRVIARKLIANGSVGLSSMRSRAPVWTLLSTH